MGLSTLRNVRFAGMASCVPKRILHNIDDAAPKIRSERERLVRNIGIQQRRICQEWQTFSDLAFDATGTLLDTLNWQREEIDALIVVTQSPDYLIPATAIILQDRLKLSQATIAFDVNLGCSGYPFGLHILGSMIASGAIKKGLVLVGDRCATLNDPLFSDAGTATALEFDPAAPPMHFDLNSDGSGYKAIMLPVGGHREPFGPQHSVPTRDEDGTLHWPSELILDGPAVLSFSTQQVPPSVRRALEYANLTAEDIDFFIFHQANRMINETIRKKLALPPEKVPSTLADFGNTSGASLPVTMTARIAETLAHGSHKLLLGGFGIGLSWGTCILDIENAVFPPLLIS
ncbi:ketoacyl-ACP synthase III [Paracidovorax valerianellae]|uniref:3-oxoacyl-[acyl-carrier-protein] synthase-3 n=1 Tax=Paracidovorax valerianellae TaxID=187868 RepID=A0A1G7D7C2_9BURK|nr:ketoacyl-ACP synthase III [Paracidovorax valerianellae]MDA8447210.1 ketoacyl-ACP synthase III [Paracidovorax valerianellae]SDE47421.1 3-oxoacyl-[acyl-carrier-protein] synthase-3 [Paracidovorax valerianellae]